MLWQYILVGSLVALAGVYLARQLWRSTKGCGGGCHCTGRKRDTESPVTQVTIIPADQLQLRRKS